MSAPVPDSRPLCLPLNHCNLPGWLIASLAFQQHPQALVLDSVALFHRDLWPRLARLDSAAARARAFDDYMTVHFRLPGHALAPWPAIEPIPRPHRHYRRLLLGWMFDSDSDDGAAWRGWVESRFGLRTLYHAGEIGDPRIDDTEAALHHYRRAWQRATWQTHELARQLDLLYSYCQYELRQRYPDRQHLLLYRGSQEPLPRGSSIRLFNNLGSYTADVDEAYRFGARVCEVMVPLSKIVCFDTLLPGSLGGEAEYMVIGGWYEVTRVT